jgi:hypothetical protein
LLEAQMLVLKAKRKTVRAIAETSPVRDLSAPIPVHNYRFVTPDTPMLIPKGFI